MALSITTRPAGFNAVHLPIMYKLTSTAWPTNSIDTARTVNTFTNDNGYTKLTLSGDVQTGLQELEFVKVTVNGVAGIYQIYQVFSDSQITIDLEYDGGTTFGTCQYYYSNYHASIKIYAGLRTGHAKNAAKPTALLTTIEAVPDASNIITINISEILKSDIGVLENSLDEVPIDLESFTEFYIEHAESYDSSTDGYTLGTYTSSYTSDSANYAIAVNSKLPFKNGYGGVMTQYDGQTQKFLTLFSEPVLFDGSYYDIFLLRNTPNRFTQLRRELYSGGTLIGTSYDAISNDDEGVYRMTVARATTEDRIDLTLASAAPVLGPLNIFTSDGGGALIPWTTGATPDVVVAGGDSSEFLNTLFEVKQNYSYTLDYSFATSSVPAAVVVKIWLLNNILATVQLVGQITMNTATRISSLTITPSVDTGDYIAIQAVNSSGTSATITVNALTYSATHLNESETKTINVNTDCSNQDIYLTWKNYLGGMDYWKFTAIKDYGIDIEATETSEKNIFANWPTSYEEQSIRFETKRDASETLVIRSQNLTLDEIEGIKYVKTSPLVQIVTGTETVPVFRTVLVDDGSFKVRSDQDKIYYMEFTITYTDMIPSQSL